MLGLRQKIIVSFGGLLAILLFVSGLGIAVLRTHQNELHAFLVDNWGSVEYGLHMLEDLDQLGDLAQSNSGEKREPSADELKNVAMTAVGYDGQLGPIPDFEKNCDLENGNVTEPGER